MYDNVVDTAPTSALSQPIGARHIPKSLQARIKLGMIDSDDVAPARAVKSLIQEVKEYLAAEEEEIVPDLLEYWQVCFSFFALMF